MILLLCEHRIGQLIQSGTLFGRTLLLHDLANLRRIIRGDPDAERNGWHPEYGSKYELRLLAHLYFFFVRVKGFKERIISVLVIELSSNGLAADATVRCNCSPPCARCADIKCVRVRQERDQQSADAASHLASAHDGELATVKLM